MTLGAGFLRNRFFQFFVFFLKIRDRQKYSLLLGGTIFNFLNFLTSILKGEAVQRRQILIWISPLGGLPLLVLLCGACFGAVSHWFCKPELPLGPPGHTELTWAHLCPLSHPEPPWATLRLPEPFWATLIPPEPPWARVWGVLCGLLCGVCGLWCGLSPPYRFALTDFAAQSAAVVFFANVVLPGWGHFLCFHWTRNPYRHTWNAHRLHSWVL